MNAIERATEDIEEALYVHGFYKTITAILRRHFGDGEWLPIETAPKDGSEIVLLTVTTQGHDHDPYPRIGSWFRSSDSGWWVSHCLPVRPTHWRPLPPPPQEQANG